jgi:hypothetical protein
MHASPEQLIALRDGEPVDASTQMHVHGCAMCGAELQTLAEFREQLSTLPTFALPEGAWESVVTRVTQGGSRSRYRHGGLRAAGVAMVASIVIAVSLAMFPITARWPTEKSSVDGARPVSVSQLVMQSQYLENAVLSLNANTDHMIISAGTAATVAALEDRIALVDYEINHAAIDPDNHGRLPQLWQQRVNLLQSLAAVRYAQVASNNI